MNTFFRYTLHFIMISFLILLIIGLLGFFNDLSFNKKVVTTIIFGALFFSISMSIIFSVFLANQKELTLSYKSEGEKNATIKELRRIVIDKLKKEEVTNDSSEYVFTEKSKYSQWLTNPIEVRIDLDSIRVVTPSCYLKYFEKLNN